LKNAAQHGHVEVMRILIAAGGCFDGGPRESMTALSLAVEQGQAACCRILLDEGVKTRIAVILSEIALKPDPSATEERKAGMAQCAVMLEKIVAAMAAEKAAAIEAAMALPKNFRFPTPNKDAEVPSGVADAIYEAQYNDDVGAMKKLCQEWAGCSAVINHVSKNNY